MSGLPWWVQWLRLHPANAGVPGWIPAWGTKIPHAVQHGQKIFKNQINYSINQDCSRLTETDGHPA